MKLGIKYVLAGIAIASLFGVYAISSSTTVSTMATYDNVPYLLGHVTFEVAGSDGVMKSYFQSDNVVTDEGFVCALARLTGSTDSSCTGSIGEFNNIALGSNGTTKITTDTAGAFVEVARKPATGILGSSSIEIKKIFTTLGSGADIELVDGETVAETALFDTTGATTGNMLAMKELPSTTVVDGDVITITWTLTGTNS